MAIFKGAGVAIVTPMKENGEINYEVFGELIEDQIAHGTDAIIAVGTSGEAPTLDDDEHIGRKHSGYCGGGHALGRLDHEHEHPGGAVFLRAAGAGGQECRIRHYSRRE